MLVYWVAVTKTTGAFSLTSYSDILTSGALQLYIALSNYIGSTRHTLNWLLKLLIL